MIVRSKCSLELATAVSAVEGKHILSIFLRMLQNGQQTLSTYPHCVFFPAIFLALLLVCFNIFGNGLRDAFNPSLRGADE